MTALGEFRPGQTPPGVAQEASSASAGGHHARTVRPPDDPAVAGHQVKSRASGLVHVFTRQVLDGRGGWDERLAARHGDLLEGGVR
jgi:hypothetical protein